jgi:hypothetical protein
MVLCVQFYKLLLEIEEEVGSQIHAIPVLHGVLGMADMEASSFDWSCRKKVFVIQV